MKTYTKNLFIEIGAYCTFLGFLGILSLIFTGMFCCLFDLSSTVYFSLLGILFAVALAVSAYNITCNSHTLKKSRK